jgi:hypothetical protein
VGERIRTMPDTGWQSVFGSNVGVRWIVSFVGAALTGIASGIAGGCTASCGYSARSGHFRVRECGSGVGEGRLDYLFPGVFGMIAGALGFGIVYQWLLPVLRIGAIGALTLPEWVGAEPWLVVLLFVELSALAVYALERPHGTVKRP